MIKRLFNFFKGYLVIALYGNALERLVSQILELGIPLWNLERIDKSYFRACIYIHDLNKLRPLLTRRLCSVKILNKKGFPFLLEKARRRYLIIISLLLFIGVLWALSCVLLFIEVDGLITLDREQILDLLDRAGVRPGIYRGSISLSKIEGFLLAQEPRLAWVNLEWQGTRLRVELLEKKLVKREIPARIVASRDAVITQLIVMQGQPLVKEGDTVSKGQLLMIGKPGNRRAEGLIKGYVWRKEIGRARLEVKQAVFTGNKKTVYGLKLGPEEIRLASRPDYRYYQVSHSIKKPFKWRNIEVPIEFIKEEYQEVNYLVEKRQQEVARFIARERAITNILQDLPRESVIIDTSFEEITEARQGLIRVKALFKTEEIIGEVQTIEEEGPGDSN